MSTVSASKADGRYLLVEDNLYIRDILESVLKQLGFGWVATARNGKKYVEAAHDLGVAEFAAKPFSAQSILDRVMKGDRAPAPVHHLFELFRP